LRGIFYWNVIMKICRICLIEKKEDEFYPRMGVCKICHNKRCRDWAIKNPKRILSINLRAKNKANKLRYDWLSKHKRRHRGIYVTNGKFQATYQHKRKRYYCGLFDTMEQAIRAYRKKEKEITGKNRIPLKPTFNYKNKTVKIPLCNYGRANSKHYGKFTTIIDLGDYKKIKDYSLSINGGYVVLSINGSLVRLHNFLFDSENTDHRNGNKLDNRKSNFRKATHTQNARNSKKPVHNGLYHKNTSPYKGVTKRNDYMYKYRTRIRVDGRLISLGTYDNEIVAAKIYDAAARKYFGEFACLNFPQRQERGAI